MGDVMIPASPNAGTADPNPLVSLNDYQRITGDGATTEDEFNYFLADALDFLQKKMSRTFLYAQYNERLFLNQDGMVYGTAVPYDTSQPVVNPASGASPANNVGIFQGYGIWVGWYIPLPSLPVWQGVVPPQTDITYWGGWVGPESPLASPSYVTGSRLIPAGLKRIICKTVWYMANPALLPNMPGGVKSTSVGGVAIAGDLSSMVEADYQLSRQIKRWRHAFARSFIGQVTTVGAGG
jgi:hypothetical protein